MDKDEPKYLIPVEAIDFERQALKMEQSMVEQITGLNLVGLSREESLRKVEEWKARQK